MNDFAHQMRWLVDTAYPGVEKIRVVLDNLNTHTPASRYQTFEPEEARRAIKRLEFHHTPKHGSWLNMAEIEISVFGNQCLNRRIGGRTKPGRGNHRLEVLYRARTAKAPAYLSISFKLTRY